MGLGVGGGEGGHFVRNLGYHTKEFGFYPAEGIKDPLIKDI